MDMLLAIYAQKHRYLNICYLVIILLLPLGFHATPEVKALYVVSLFN